MSFYQKRFFMKDFPRKFLVYALQFMIYGLILCGCISTEYNIATGKQDVFLYSTAREVSMGQNIAKRIAKEFKLSRNPYDIQRVDKIAKKIVENVDRSEISYYFYVIEEDQEAKSQINAFSIPGGYVYIYKELLDLLSDDEVAFVIAHEVGHIVSRHQIKRLQAAMGYNLVMVASSVARSSPEFQQGLSFALAQIFMGYSRQDEFNADELAVKYCRMAGFDPSVGIAVQEKLYKENKKKINPLSYFRTHPYTAQRIRHIKETLHLPLDVADYIN